MYTLTVSSYGKPDEVLGTYEDEAEAFWTMVQHLAMTGNLPAPFHCERIRREFFEYGRVKCNGYALAKEGN